MDLPKHVELIEVCPRDGFQNVHDIIPFEGKVAIIKKLAEAGFKRLEVVSFVSPKAIPQMADAKDVVAAVKDTLKEHGVRTVALVPNARGVETAVECGIDELTYVISVSKAHNMANVRRTPEESMEQFKALIQEYGHKIDFRLALATALGNASNMVMVHLASGYGDIPVAAYGIVKRIDQFPLNVSMGLCQRFMPLAGYTFAAKNYRRMRSVSVFSWTVALALSACFAACFAAFAPQILHLFIPEAETSALGARFLRIACLAVPLTSVNFLISYTLQAMGKGVQSAALTFSRQGLLNIPLLLLMNALFGLYGMIWTQLVVEVLMLPVSLGMYAHTFRRIRSAQPDNAPSPTA